VHAGLTDNFLDEDVMGEFLSNGLGGFNGCSAGGFLIDVSDGFFSGFGYLGVGEDIEGKSLLFG